MWRPRGGARSAAPGEEAPEERGAPPFTMGARERLVEMPDGADLDPEGTRASREPAGPLAEPPKAGRRRVDLALLAALTAFGGAALRRRRRAGRGRSGREGGASTGLEEANAERKQAAASAKGLLLTDGEGDDAAVKRLAAHPVTTPADQSPTTPSKQLPATPSKQLLYLENQVARFDAKVDALDSQMRPSPWASKDAPYTPRRAQRVAAALLLSRVLLALSLALLAAQLVPREALQRAAGRTRPATAELTPWRAILRFGGEALGLVTAEADDRLAAPCTRSSTLAKWLPGVVYSGRYA